MTPVEIALLIGFSAGVWLGYRIGAKLATFSLFCDLLKKLKD
jgi:hypothetical protein